MPSGVRNATCCTELFPQAVPGSADVCSNPRFDLIMTPEFAYVVNVTSLADLTWYS